MEQKSRAHISNQPPHRQMSFENLEHLPKVPQPVVMGPFQTRCLLRVFRSQSSLHWSLCEELTTLSEGPRPRS